MLYFYGKSAKYPDVQMAYNIGRDNLKPPFDHFFIQNISKMHIIRFNLL